MNISSQRLNYKIKPLDQKYFQKLEQKMKYSHTSFNDIETPGWTSLMKSEISEKNNRRESTLKQKNQNIPLTESQFNEKGHKRFVREPQYQANDHVQSKKNLESVETFGKDRYQTKDTMALQKMRVNKSMISTKPEKRWNQLTVHEHLYLNSFKMQHKRMIERQIDDEYKKKQICPFHPTINEKSILLAESKYSRIRQSQIGEDKVQDKNETKTSIQERDSKEVQRYKLLNKTFYFLTENESILTKNGLERRLQKLPLSCIQSLEPIIQQLYKGKILQWIDFLEIFNGKSIKKKESFYCVMKKWFQRNNHD